MIASNAAIKESGLSPEHINSVCIGNVLSASAPDAPYLARHVALKCGLPVPTPALIGISVTNNLPWLEDMKILSYHISSTVNRLCGSGFQSIVNGVQEILAGDAQVKDLQDFHRAIHVLSSDKIRKIILSGGAHWRH